MLLSWDIVGVATGVTATVSLLASFGDQIIGLHSDGGLVWCHSKALLAQTSGASPATPSAWKRLSVWDEAGATWPSPTAPLQCMAAPYGAMQLFAVDATGSLFVMVAGPKPSSSVGEAALRGTAAADAAKKVSRAVRIGTAPRGVHQLIVHENRLYCVAEWESGCALYHWSNAVDAACAAAVTALLASTDSDVTVTVSLPASTWTPLCDATSVRATPVFPPCWLACLLHMRAAAPPCRRFTWACWAPCLWVSLAASCARCRMYHLQAPRQAP